ncbi:hypothetical protein [Pseudoxanthomonas gei]|uniref:hypothetical protein n=1 Tax=Pseudoxanthomonas gei TaxID=1383030 RepID=UPI001391C2B3|nr:hypothetical protein [Pseudoxanthomonas gei]
MKTLAASNRHLSTASARKDGVERNVRSSSAIEGVSSKVFRNAATGQYVTGSKDRGRIVVKEQRPKK